MFIFFLNFAQAKDFGTFINEILNLISNTYMKALGSLIILGVGIYMIKEKERIKEIFVTCIIIIIGVAVIVNAKEISNYIFDSAK
ncbi:hypothetical protein BKH45_04360 [Helicobacter sp. 11S03491-1]|nr:hypothetical protein BKH45_04360 [Helicobacter sp. 11S03491-1]